ncbi:response regulator [Mangrovimonas spongiae]|uniref:histidine kinase n=1 Tax=Mangrovimonas spongiae TaxID=2494697 RepID=A0A428K6P1_9FLAO|nr:response regulator [Mangrovimonas spongiae]RSK42116.1 response regulator [Mangrovimonas spongiae]
MKDLSKILTSGRNILILPIAIFVGLTTVAYFIWDKSIEDYQIRVKEQIQLTGTLSTQEFIKTINKEVQRVENLKNRLEISEGDYHKHWKKETQMILNQSHSIKFIEWIDSSMVITKITPVKENINAIGLDISKVDYRKDDWIKHTKQNTINITPWSRMTQGGHAFLIDVPAYYNNTFQGTVTAGMDFTQNFEAFSQGLDNFCVELTDHNGTVFYSYNMPKKANVDDSYTFTSLLKADKLKNQDWELKLYPTKKLLSSTEERTFINYTLLFGLMLSFLLSLLSYFYHKSLKETQKALDSNTRLANLNLSLKKEKRKAEEASKAKTDFLSNMSHEIRTPLHAILGFIQILKQGNFNDSEKEYIDLMGKSSKNLLAIVNDILEIHKIESGTVTLEESSFSPLKKVKDITDTFQLQFAEKNLFLKTNLTQNVGIKAYGDKNKFSQVFTNLLKNALKFTEKGGINVSYTEQLIDDKLNIKVSIKDTGVGIPESKVKTIFKRFTQLDSSLKKQHEGSGLGLAISKEFSELLNGNITVESSEDNGSTFVFTSSFKVSDNQEYVTEKSIDNLQLEHLNVLIVDDNNINVIVLKKLLEEVNIQVDIANNGLEALKKTKTADYHLIFMDIHMPEMDGYEATKNIRKVNDQVVIIGLSANVTTTAIEKAINSGMTNYLTKPFVKERLYKLINMYFPNNK